MKTAIPGKKVVDILTRNHTIDAEALIEAKEEAESTGTRLEKLLVEKKLVSGAAMALALSEYLKMPALDISTFQVNSDLLDLLPQETMQRHLMLPICKTARMLTLAMGDPFDLMGIEEVQSITGFEIVPVIAPERQVFDVLQKFSQEQKKGLEDILKDVGDNEVEIGQEVEEDINIDQVLESAEDAPVIRIVNSILVEALSKRVSDIHIEPMEKTIRLRYRIDGVLYENPSPPKQLQAAITSRIKIMSNLDIAERRIPQDGRFKIKALGKEVDLRVSLLPTVHGEKCVMRILDKSNLAPSVDSLGLDQQAYDDFVYALAQPHGMILVTGPTGSGKTTTLYSGLQELNTPETNIVTTEDPVEYQLEGINQVQTKAGVGLTFAAALKSILRQDPDIVMVGEIRDGETATIAVQAALTGHLVLSTLHTNDAAAAIARLSYMGVEPFLLASSIVMTQAQRLYRRLCPACRKPRDLPAEVFIANHMDPEIYDDGTQYFEPRGCPKCAQTGYQGRGAIMEILLLNEAIKEAILRNENATAIRDIAVENGMLSLRDVGMLRVKEGKTTVEEVIRVSTGH